VLSASEQRSAAPASAAVLAQDPVLSSVLEYARRIRAGRDFAALADIDLFELPSAVPNIFTMSVTGQPPLFKYKFSGSQVDVIMGGNPMGRTIDEIYPRPGHKIVDSYADLTRVMKPQLLRAAFAPAVGPPRILLRLAIPLCNDGKTLSHVFGALVMHYDHLGYRETPSPARPSVIDVEYLEF
jgi:hypothetical protein